jgi:hypothetical protein
MYNDKLSLMQYYSWFKSCGLVVLEAIKILIAGPARNQVARPRH